MGFLNRQKPAETVALLEITCIQPSAYQPREVFDPDALAELAESIEQNGLLQPIIVRPLESGYELIAGERRLRACRMLHMERIPAIVREIGDKQAAVLALIENLQRKDLNFFELARGISRLMDETGLTQEETARRLGKAQSTVANKLRLLQFSASMQERMLRAGLTERHARALLRLPEEQVEAAIAQIVASQLNVGETERLVEQLLDPAEEPEAGPAGRKSTQLFVVKDLRIFMNTISKAVGTMKLAGIEVSTQQTEDEEYFHYTLQIPKRCAYRTPSR